MTVSLLITRLALKIPGFNILLCNIYDLIKQSSKNVYTHVISNKKCLCIVEKHDTNEGK